jgi:hypothetical protein
LLDLPPRRMPSEVRAGLQARIQPLETLLDLGTDAFIRLAVSASHSRSGFRRTISRKFRRGDITEGEFVGDSVEVKLKPSPEDGAVNSEPSAGCP